MGGGGLGQTAPGCVAGTQAIARAVGGRPGSPVGVGVPHGGVHPHSAMAPASSRGFVRQVADCKPKAPTTTGSPHAYPKWVEPSRSRAL